MRLRNAILLFLVSYVLSTGAAHAQDSTFYSKLYNLPDKLFSSIGAKSKAVEEKLTKQTEKYLTRLAKREKKLRDKLWKKDSAAAKELFGNVTERYEALQNKFAGKQTIYSGHLDSMETAFRFLDQNMLLNQGAAAKENLQSVLGNYKQFQDRLNQTGEIKKYLKERQQFLKQQLAKFGFAKEFRKFQKDVYYYRAQVDEYKRMFEDPSSLEAKLLQLTMKVPGFRNFFDKYSALAGMFRLSSEDISSGAAITGLQTRASIQEHLARRFGTNPDIRQAMQQNMRSAQAHLNQLKNKIGRLGRGKDDIDIPGFRPNNQKTKSFWDRIEIGTNMQNTRGNTFFPVTSDLAFSAGYKLNDRNIVGLGISYKLGWGQNIRHIKLTHEGAGLRSFLDVKLKGSFYISGGFEYNYQQPFNSMQQLYGSASWRKSGLIGISKTVSVQSKFFEKTRVQLLWDFMSYQQVPRTQAVLFRAGYFFK